jgi:hypothetical protein
MATHDLHMTHFAQWWRRSMRGGYGALKLTLFGPLASRAIFRRQVRSVVIWGFVVPLIAIATAVVASTFDAGLWSFVFLALWPVGLLLQGARLTVTAHGQGYSMLHALAYSFFTLLWKYAALGGFILCLRDRWRERSTSGAATREFHKSAV